MMLGFCSLAISNKFLTNFSLSPNHLDTRSLLDTEKKVELFASVATALARYDLPVPGGPNKRMPRHGFLFPVKRCGNLIGRITASFNASFAASRPATSLHLILGFSITIASLSFPCIFFFSGSSSSSESEPLSFLLSLLAPSLIGFFFRGFGDQVYCLLQGIARHGVLLTKLSCRSESS